ncbi:hypothetical protein RhiirA5_420332 [Rhizophagus irregularis]|uniref:F-box domain-containing protein n=1 Tax=Rhizophagus irregularis TaxID=588596 RepID=A0A2I1F9P7_9GLOM|nr:hypothetical protein RhiirA5_420332 [Rhizophagus irregularis]PKC63743.1 hypothetical protein RhiirA1_537560 [Rhizophagus irregularis]PKY31088.1 hypothetical protein RhiirB3_448513 [Rhizophagus irregularis]CAB4484767.1 unnamed protein product [Rhizophagus irregularis]CAB5188824.1 unnamed protein product [Rhizophagus irregularis]
MSHNKPIVKLPADCINDIFHFVEDRITLYSCLFVNHFCFHLIIPKLWSNPFSFTLPTNKLSSIIKTYIKCLPKDRINYLLNENIITTNNSYLTTSSSIEYHKFLIDFEYVRILYSINCWYDENNNQKPETQEILTNEIFGNLFFNQINKMKNIFFHINYHTMYLINDEDIKFVDITSYGGSIEVLSQVQEFDIEYHFEQFDFSDFVNFNELNHLISLTKNLLNSLISNNKNIKCLCLDYKPFIPTNDSKEIMKLFTKVIEQQKNLETLDISDSTDTFTYKRFHPSLITQANSLTFLRLEFQITIDHFFLLILELKCLHTIELPVVPYQDFLVDNNSNILTREDKITFESVSKNTIIKFNLKNIFFLPKEGYPHRSEDSCKVLQTLLEYSNKSVETLTIFSLSNDFIPTISLNCPNITHISMIIDNNNLISCLKLFSELQNLYHLKLKSSNIPIVTTTTIDRLQIYFDENIIWDLVKQIPITLKILELDLLISSKDLKKFLLENCEASLKEITFHNKELITNQHFKVLLEYVEKKKSLRKFSFNSNYLNDDYFLDSGGSNNNNDDDGDDDDDDDDNDGNNYYDGMKSKEYSGYIYLEELMRLIPDISDPIDVVNPFYEY